MSGGGGNGNGGNRLANSAERAVAAALAAKGVRFRLHGRDPRFGLDCVGLASLAMRAAGYKGAVPADYGLRGGGAEEFALLIDAHLLVRVDEPRPGDLLLCAPGPAAFHLAVLVPGGFVHADAVARRVVERPGAPPWPVIAAWRWNGED